METEKVYVQRGSGSAWAQSEILECSVIRRTPSGQTVVKRVYGEQRFDKHGYEISGSKYYGDRLVTKDKFDQSKIDRKKRHAVRNIKTRLDLLAVEKFNTHYDTVDKEALVAELKIILEQAEAL